MTKHLSPLGFVAAATTLAALAGCHQPSQKPVADKIAQVERGRLLVSIGGCNDCHTPMKFDADVGMPVPDMSRMLSGHPEGAPDPEDRAYAGELGEVLQSEIGRLPDGQRLIFIMRHHQGLKLCEIADALGLAEGTVKRQLHAAVHRLRHALTRANVTAGGRA